MTTRVTTPEEFIERWRTPPNLRVSNVLTAASYVFPSALDVLDVVRRDEEVRFTILGDEDWSVCMDRTSAFRTAPIEEVATWTFRLVHFNLTRFYEGILSGFQEDVMIPWRTAVELGIHLATVRATAVHLNWRRLIDVPQRQLTRPRVADRGHQDLPQL